MNQETKQALVKVVATWWADRLRKPVDHRIVNPLRAGGFSVEDALIGGMQSILRQRYLDEAKIPLFEEELERIILEKLVGWKSDVMFLRVDYTPCKELRQAAQVAFNYDMKYILPEKADMWIHLDPPKIEVSVGHCVKKHPVELTDQVLTELGIRKETIRQFLVHLLFREEADKDKQCV